MWMPEGETCEFLMAPLSGCYPSALEVRSLSELQLPQTLRDVVDNWRVMEFDDCTL